MEKACEKVTGAVTSACSEDHAWMERALTGRCSAGCMHDEARRRQVGSVGCNREVVNAVYGHHIHEVCGKQVGNKGRSNRVGVIAGI